MDFVICGSSIDECLKKASEKLDISKNDIKYKIIKEEHKFFKKKIEIQILNNLENEKNIVKDVEKHNESGAKVEKGKIIVKRKDDNPIKIIPSENIKLFLNGIECNEIYDAKEDDEIFYEFKIHEAKHNIKISISEDKMESFIDINSKPQPIYELIDTEFENELILNAKEVGEKYPEKYTKEEIINELKLQGVIYGIINENLEKACSENSIKRLLIARGKLPVDDICDTVKIMFNKKDEIEENEKIDYRNLHSISNVNNGDIIAEKIPGKEGVDGCNVLGKAVKRQIAKPIILKAGTGCFVDGNNVIAEIKGKPSVKNYVFSVHEVYEIKDVNLTSGNINFIGDVNIINDVAEGMQIKAGKSIYVGKNVEYAHLEANQVITVKGNIVNSVVKAGCDTVEQDKYIKAISDLEHVVDELIICVQEIKKSNMLVGKKDGEIIKILLENKFKNMNSLIKNLLKCYKEREIEELDFAVNLKSKLIGMGPLEVKDISEISEIREKLNKEKGQAEEILESESDVYLEYCQSSNVEAAGSVFVNGKGQFTSNIIAFKNIEFTKDGAVCRGGTLYAEKEIKLKTVGSSAGVSTVLKVSRKGKISADLAYSNTIFCFGERQFVLDVSSKNVVAYLDENDEIMIEKLHL